MSDLDLASMARAVELARRGIGRVEPNPPVGAVLVRDGRVVGEGWHRIYGGPHAEVEALRAAGEAARGGTLYVTLEPCCHWGKTPPCTDAILGSGLGEVVYGLVDPNPAVQGGGVRVLEAAGVAVRRLGDDSACRELAAAYLKWRSERMPWVLAKWAMTLDGKIATRTGDSKWVSSEASRRRVHEARDRAGAVLVGIGTALADDPLLTCRIEGGRQPLRVVVDSLARLPLSSQLVVTLGQAPVLVAASEDAPLERVRALAGAGVEVLRFPRAGEAGVDLGGLLGALAARDRVRLLVEGGPRLFGSLFDQRLVDEVEVYLAPKIAGGAAAPGPVGGLGIEWMREARGLDRLAVEEVEGDLLVRAIVRRG